MDRVQFTIRDLFLTTTVIAVACLCVVWWDKLQGAAFLIVVVAGGALIGTFVGALFNQKMAGAVIGGFLAVMWCSWMIHRFADGLGGI